MPYLDQATSFFKGAPALLGSTKEPAIMAEVVDLCASSDDEAPPGPPMRRQHTQPESIEISSDEEAAALACSCSWQTIRAEAKPLGRTCLAAPHGGTGQGETLAWDLM